MDFVSDDREILNQERPMVIQHSSRQADRLFCLKVFLFCLSFPFQPVQ